MLKYAETMITFSEIPGEVSLCINIANCPCQCPGCHSKHLWQDKGKDLTQRALLRLIDEYDGASCVCFMGGDSEPDLVNMLAEVVKRRGRASAWYSGRDEISNKIDVKNFDYIKIGHFNGTPIDNKETNQRLYEVLEDGSLKDITYKLWK